MGYFTIYNRQVLWFAAGALSISMLGIIAVSFIGLCQPKGFYTTGFATYLGPELKLMFTYPRAWEGSTDGNAVSFRGEAGFVTLSPLAGDSEPLTELALKAVQSNVFGQAPQLETIVAGGQPGVLIRSSVPGSTQVAAVVRYPEPIAINGIAYRYALIGGDERLGGILASLQFISNTTGELSGIPNVFVYSPILNQKVSKQIAVFGAARVFENTVNLELSNGSGSVLASGFATAAAPDVGTYGTFTGILEAPYGIPPGEPLFVRAFQASAEDGTSRDIVEIRVVTE